MLLDSTPAPEELVADVKAIVLAAPALTVIGGEVLAVLVASVMSVAVRVGVPAVLRVTL